MLKPSLYYRNMNKLLLNVFLLPVTIFLMDFFFFFVLVSSICLHGKAIWSFKLEFDGTEARH